MKGETEQLCLQELIASLQGRSTTGNRPLQCVFLTHNRDIRRYILEAKANPQKSRFPDFLFETGFIEHFRVTAAKEDKKGSELKKAEVGFKKECEKQMCILQDRMEQAPGPGVIVQAPEMRYDQNSYRFFFDSFKKNWTHHIKSFEQYDGEKRVGVFLIESEATSFKEMINGKYSGRLYRIQDDKDLLEFIFPYRDQIQYVIFEGAQLFEIIEIDLIPELIKRIPNGLSFDPGVQYITNLQIGIII